MARELGFNFPFCYDETQEVAKAYMAACTPDFFLFDGGRKLVYRGQPTTAVRERDSGHRRICAPQSTRPSRGGRSGRTKGERRLQHQVEPGNARATSGAELGERATRRGRRNFFDPAARSAALSAGRSRALISCHSFSARACEESGASLLHRQALRGKKLGTPR